MFLCISICVSVSQAVIQGSPEMYIRSGSDIRLSCLAKELPEPPTHFTWFKGGHIFSHQSHASHAHKVSIETSQPGTENHLSIRNAATLDSGNYTCIPAGAKPASIVVHVLNGSFIIPLPYVYVPIRQIPRIATILRFNYN